MDNLSPTAIHRLNLETFYFRYTPNTRYETSSPGTRGITGFDITTVEFDDTGDLVFSLSN